MSNNIQLLPPFDVPDTNSHIFFGAGCHPKESTDPVRIWIRSRHTSNKYRWTLKGLRAGQMIFHPRRKQLQSTNLKQEKRVEITIVIQSIAKYCLFRLLF